MGMSCELLALLRVGEVLRGSNSCGTFVVRGES